MSERYRKKRKRKYEEDEDPKLKAKIPYRSHFPSGGKLGFRSRGGGGRSRPSKYIKHHDFKYQPEPKYKPKPERLTAPRGDYGWTEPKQPKSEKIIIRNEPDAEDLLHMLERNPELYDRLSEKILRRMEKDFKDQSEAMGVKDYGELPQEDSEKPVEKAEEKDNPSKDEELTESSHEIAGSFFYDSMAGSVPRKDTEAQGESVETEERQDFLEDRHLEDEAEVLGDTKAEKELEGTEPNEDQIKEETSTELPETETEPAQNEIEPIDAQEPSTDIIEQIEAQDLSSLEAELYSELVEPIETEEEVEAEGY